MERNSDNDINNNPEFAKLVRTVATIVATELKQDRLSEERLRDIESQVWQEIGSMTGIVRGSLQETTSPRTKLTPPELAKRLGISPDKVLAWIRNGELRAVNVAMKAYGRPRYVIDQKDVEAFEQNRSNGRQEPDTRSRSSHRSNVIEFF